MNELTLIIPAKNEAESLPIVLNELKKYNYKIDIVLHSTDIDTIQAIKNYEVNIVYQENFGYGDALNSWYQASAKQNIFVSLMRMVLLILWK